MNERRVGLRAEPFPRQRRDRRLAERRRDEQPARILEQRGERSALLARRPQRDHQRHRQLVEAPLEVGEEAQARLVRPLEVVDGEQQRPLGGQVGDEPVQPVQHGVARLGLLRAGRHRPGQPDGGRRERGRAVQQTGVARDRALEERAHDAEAEVALELAAARFEDGQAGRAGEARGLLEQPRLADPGRPLDREEPAAAAARRADERLQPVHLSLSLEQHEHRGSHPLDVDVLRLVRQHHELLAVESAELRP